MLESIRSSAQSIGVKIAFGIIILVFVFWGVGNFNDRDYSNVVAMVNGEPIVALEFEKAYQNAEEYILKNNPGITREELAKQHLGRQVLQDMISQMLISQEAKKSGLAITPLELRKAAEAMPAYQNQQGKFDPELYRQVLDARRISPVQFEKELSNELLREKMAGIFASGVWVGFEEAKNRYNYLREKRTADYIFVPASKFSGKINIGKDEIKAWYDERKESFVTPALADILYINVRPQSLEDPAKIPEKDVRAYYDANKSRFETKPEADVAHILVPVREDANENEQKKALEKVSEISKELEKGISFGEIADKYNKPGAANAKGEIGWITTGQTVEPFEKAVFSAETGKVTAPVRTPFGWHLILVKEKKPASVKSFKDAEQEIRLQLAAEAGADKLQDVLDNLIEDNILQKPLKESAEKYGLMAERSGMLSREKMIEKLGITEKGADAIFSASSGMPLDTALEAGNGYIIAKIENTSPKTIKPLEEVEKEITEQINNKKTLEASIKEAQELLDKAKSIPYEKFKNDRVKTAMNIERGGNFENFESDPALNEAIFITEPGKWLDKPYKAASDKTEGALIVRVEKIADTDMQEFEKVKDILNNAAMEDRKDAIFGTILQKLSNNAKIEITNASLVDRVKTE